MRYTHHISDEERRRWVAAASVVMLETIKARRNGEDVPTDDAEGLWFDLVELPTASVQERVTALIRELGPGAYIDLGVFA